VTKEDENKKAILARRARFVAAALTATTGCHTGSGGVGIAAPGVPDAGVDAAKAKPRACFSFSQNNTYNSVATPDALGLKKK
jgi:hypothetical protein